MAFHPTDVSPCLTIERLQLLADTIVAVRVDCLEGHEPEKGDSSWTFGCRAYGRTCFAFDKLARSGEHPWLRVDREALRCTLTVEGEPIRFFRGDADKPSARTVRRGLEEAMRQGKLPFFDEELAAEPEGWFWMMAVETYEDGTVMRVVVVQANRYGDVRHHWTVPVAQNVAIASAVTTNIREGVDLPPPVVAPKTLGNEATRDATTDGDA